MKTHEEELEVFGYLYTPYGTYPMLAKYPNVYDVPFGVRELGFLSFYVEDDDGFAKILLFKSDNLMIKPLLEPKTKTVHFLIEEENIKVDSLE